MGRHVADGDVARGVTTLEGGVTGAGGDATGGQTTLGGSITDATGGGGGMGGGCSGCYIDDRGFTEIGYIPKSRVIFKKNR